MSLLAVHANAQIYGFTNDKGVLILSNVPTDSRMNLIARGSPEEAGKVWRYNGQYDTVILRAARDSGVDHALVKAVIAAAQDLKGQVQLGVGRHLQWLPLLFPRRVNNL